MSAGSASPSPSAVPHFASSTIRNASSRVGAAMTGPLLRLRAANLTGEARRGCARASGRPEPSSSGSQVRVLAGASPRRELNLMVERLERGESEKYVLDQERPDACHRALSRTLRTLEAAAHGRCCAARLIDSRADEELPPLRRHPPRRSKQ